MDTRARAYSWTFFYPDEGAKVEAVNKLTAMSHKYLCYGEEKCPDTGRLHLQGYFSFKSAKKFSCLKKEFPSFHFQVAVADAYKNKLYCSKTRPGDIPNEVFFESGVIPEPTGSAGGEANKRKWSASLEAAKSGGVDDIEPEMLIKYYSTFRRIERDYMVKPQDLDNVCGIWYYGATGTGKSHAARADFPGAYNKLPNKWWDGYQREDFVLIDDFDVVHGVLGYHLKIWADKYAFSAEVKGSTISIRPKTIVVTSNYHPSEIWGDKPQTLDPILERFRVVQFSGASRRVRPAVNPCPVDEERDGVSLAPGFRLPVTRRNIDPIPSPLLTEDLQVDTCAVPVDLDFLDCL